MQAEATGKDEHSFQMTMIGNHSVIVRRRGQRAIITAARIALLLLLVARLHAELRLPAVFGDHMVLQSGMPVPVWGKAAPNARVAVSFAGHTTEAAADAQGFWKVDLRPLQPQRTASEMTVMEFGGAAPVVIHDVLVGEVWLACGQSNMAYPLSSMEGKDAYIQNAANPEIRFFEVSKTVASTPLGLLPGLNEGDVQGKWVIADAKTAAAFSAVGGLFAHELQDRLQRPVGVISTNWGGTPIQTWMALDSFYGNAALAPDLAKYQEQLAKHKEVTAVPDAAAHFRSEYDAWYSEIGKAQADRMREWNKVHEAGGDPGPRPVPARPEPRNPDPIGEVLGNDRPHTPSSAFNAMISPLAPFAAKGVLWYQGEENVSHWEPYAAQLTALISGWRAAWNEPALDFLVVQLPAFGKNEEPRNLPHLREAQEQILSLPYTALIVSIDVGNPDNVHPGSKVDVAHRLVLAALGEAYRQHIAFRGPTLEHLAQDGDKLTLRFRDDSGKLVIGQSPWVAKGAKQFPADRLVGFEVAGQNGNFVAAQAEIRGMDVVLHAADVKQPQSVRYAWDQSPQANLYDDAGVPAMPFRAQTGAQALKVSR